MEATVPRWFAISLLYRARAEPCYITSMNKGQANIYEVEGGNLTQETERLRGFDLPTRVSIEVITPISTGVKFLDIGAGPNTQLLEFVHLQGGIYTALDKNPDLLKAQSLAGATTVKGDIRDLPLQNSSFDIVHARFVIAHLGEDKQKAIREAIRVTKPGGKAIFIDYDWSSARGSDAYNKVRDFMINGGFLFDADFGATLEKAVRESSAYGTLSTKSIEPAFMSDYSQVLKLRQAGITDLRMQNNEAGVDEWISVLDDLQKESETNEAPGFHFPGMNLVVLTKD